jgi:hypothetical protein
MAEPGAFGGRGHLRASHADREHVIEVLKTAFVQGRLTKDELDTRVGQAFSSRTHAELAAVTADLPTARLAGPSRRAPSARAQRPENAIIKKGARVLTTATVLVGGLWAAGLASGNAVVGALLPAFTFAWLGIMMLVGAVMADAWQRKRSGRRPPARRTLDDGGPPSGRAVPAGGAGEPPPIDRARRTTAEAVRHRDSRAWYPIGRAAEALLCFSLTSG